MRVYYPNSSADNKAANILAAFSPDTVDDVIGLVTRHGSSIKGTVFNNDKEGPPRPFAIFSDAYISDEQFPAIWYGLLATVIAGMKTTYEGSNFYRDTLKVAFDMPDSMAVEMANKIETKDILSGPKGSGFEGWITAIWAQAMDGLKGVANTALNVLHMPTFELTQKYDTDYLFELRNLGLAVDELMQRASLITAQAAIASGLNLFTNRIDKAAATGDPASDNDVAYQVGDVARILTARPLPVEAYGGAAPVAHMGKHTALGMAKGIANHSIGSSDQLAETGFPGLVGLIGNLFKKKNKGSTLLGMLGLPEGLLQQLLGGSNAATSDPAGEGSPAAARVYHEFGDAVHHHYVRGNVPGMMQSAMALLNEPDTTGDPQLDAAILANLDRALQESGDPSYDEPEVGGLFKKLRAKWAIKRGKRRRKKAAKNAYLNQAKEFADYKGDGSELAGSHLDPNDLNYMQDENGGTAPTDSYQGNDVYNMDGFDSDPA